MVTPGRNKNLGFMFQPPEGLAVYNLIPVALECGAQFALLFWFCAAF
jgi:hypothetical protein